MQQLPADVLEEILSRLHVKDLLRYKSVSKTWNLIISSQHFIRLHLKKAISSASHRRIFSPDAESIENDIQYDIKELPRPEEATGYFLGSSDGLVCYLDNYNVHPPRICMWNPATRVFKTVYLKFKFHRIISWFGRESSDDEYKIVLGIRPCKEEEEEPINHMQLISLSVDDCHRDLRYYSTEEISMDQLFFNSHKEGTLLNGTVHWLALQNYYSVVMFTYNLSQKSIGESIPTPLKLQMYSESKIGVIDGCLSAICRNGDGVSVRFEVWIMKEYGMKQSWTKLMVIPHPGGDIEPLIVVGVGGYGDIFFRSLSQEETLLIYNVAENKYTALVCNGFLVKTYVETLVSPKVSRKGTITAA